MVYINSLWHSIWSTHTPYIIRRWALVSSTHVRGVCYDKVLSYMHKCTCILSHLQICKDWNWKSPRLRSCTTTHSSFFLDLIFIYLNGRGIFCIVCQALQNLNLISTSWNGFTHLISAAGASKRSRDHVRWMKRYTYLISSVSASKRSRDHVRWNGITHLISAVSASKRSRDHVRWI
jgi:hypothetical protein